MSNNGSNGRRNGDCSLFLLFVFALLVLVVLIVLSVTDAVTVLSVLPALLLTRCWPVVDLIAIFEWDFPPLCLLKW